MAVEDVSTFVENLRLTAGTSTAGVDVFEDKARWHEITDYVAEIAEKLYDEDLDGKREFLACVLGVQPVQAALEQPAE